MCLFYAAINIGFFTGHIARQPFLSTLGQALFPRFPFYGAFKQKRKGFFGKRQSDMVEQEAC